MTIPIEFLIVSLIANAILAILWAERHSEVKWYHERYLSLIDERIAAIKAERERESRGEQ